MWYYFIVFVTLLGTREGGRTSYITNIITLMKQLIQQNKAEKKDLLFGKTVIDIVRKGRFLLKFWLIDSNA